MPRLHSVRPTQFLMGLVIVALSYDMARAQTPTTITLTSNDQRPTFGRTLTVEAHVRPAPSGTVAFYDGVQFLGTGTFANHRSANFTTSQLLPGVHELKAKFIASSGYDQSTSSTLKRLVHSTAVGSFSLGQTLTPIVGTSFITADFNRDGKLDVAASDGTILYIYLGNGNGTFQAPLQYPVFLDGSFSCSAVTSLASADLRGIGVQDLVIAAYCYDPYINGSIDVQSWALGQGDGTFQFTAYGSNIGASTAHISTADFNNDGLVDFAVSGYTFGAFIFTGISTSIDAYVTATHSLPNNDDLVSIAIADFNRDGNPDLLFVQGTPATGVGVILGNGSFTLSQNFGGPAMFASVNEKSLGVPVVCDFNLDGIPDLAIPVPGGFGVLLGIGDGTFGPEATYQTPSVGSTIPSVASGDLNGDGIPDIIATGEILLGNGDGTFQPARTVVNAAPGVVGNFNGDGRVDLLVQTSSGGLQVILGQK